MGALRLQEGLPVTGAGVVTAAGVGRAALRGALLAGPESPPRFAALAGDGRYPYAALPAELGAEASPLGILDLCLEEILESSGLSAAELRSEETALVLGAIAGLQPRWQPGGPPRHMADAVDSRQFCEDEIMEMIAGRWRLRGPRFAVNTACASSASAMLLAADLIRSGFCRRALVGGAAVLTWFDVHGFRSSRLLAPEAARPFDRDPQGLMLGEGGALVLLEEPGTARQPMTVLRGWSSNVERQGIATPEPSGESLHRCIGGALAACGLDPGAISYVNAHGTGTASNDSSEARALARLWSDRPGDASISSTKGLHGHLLAAAGAVELVVTMIALASGVAPATWGCREPGPECAWNCVVGSPARRAMRYGVSVSRGFGGLNVSLVLDGGPS